MNQILIELVRKAVAGEITAEDAMICAWESGIQEGMARQRVKTIVEMRDCSKACASANGFECDCRD